MKSFLSFVYKAYITPHTKKKEFEDSHETSMKKPRRDDDATP